MSMHIGLFISHTPLWVPGENLGFPIRLLIMAYPPSSPCEAALDRCRDLRAAQALPQVGDCKQVTVMFCDMEGYTALSERLGPERIYSIMDEVFETLIHKVHDYGGTGNKMTGDGMMALFGAPIAVKDAPQRAIRSALAIHREMTKSQRQ